MSFNHFTDSLGDGFFHTVAGRGPIELVDGKKPVKGDENRFIAGEIETPGPFHGKGFVDLATDIKVL